MTDEQVTESAQDFSSIMGDDAQLEQELASMRDSENETQEVSNDDTSGEAEETEADQATDEAQEADEAEEEYQPEEYKHNKNYKAAMEAERREKAEIKRQMREIREESTKYKEALNRILTSIDRQTQPQEVVPDFESDPIGALKYENEKLKQNLEKINQRDQQFEQTSKQHQAMNQLVKEYQSKAQEFSRSTPDFNDAYSYVVNQRLSEYEAAGYSRDDAIRLVNEDEAAIVVKALQDDVNPAERIYSLAKVRGYQKQQAQQKPNVQKLDVIEKGLRASKTLNTSSNAKTAPLSIESLDAMSDEEFDKIDWDKSVRSLFN